MSGIRGSAGASFFIFCSPGAWREVSNHIFVDDGIFGAAAWVGPDDDAVALRYKVVDSVFRQAGDIALFAENPGAGADLHVIDGRCPLHHPGVAFRLRGILLAGTVETAIDTALFALFLAVGADDLHICGGERRIARAVNQRQPVFAHGVLVGGFAGALTGESGPALVEKASGLFAFLFRAAVHIDQLLKAHVLKLGQSMNVRWPILALTHLRIEDLLHLAAGLGQIFVPAAVGFGLTGEIAHTVAQLVLAEIGQRTVGRSGLAGGFWFCRGQLIKRNKGFLALALDADIRAAVTAR